MIILTFDLLKSVAHGPCSIVINKETTSFFMFKEKQICFKRAGQETFIEFDSATECELAYEFILESIGKENVRNNVGVENSPHSPLDSMYRYRESRI